MRHWLCTLSAAAILASGSAFADDLGRGPPPAPLPPPLPTFTWTGFYIGANAGGAWSDEGFGFRTPVAGAISAVCGVPAGAVAPNPTVAPFDLEATCNKSSSFIGGGQIGYNWQTGSIVFGLEAQGDWQRLVEHSYKRYGSDPTTGFPFGSVANDTAYLRAEQDGLGALLGRVGYAPGNWLLYAQGGLAIAGVRHQVVAVLYPGNVCTPGLSSCEGTSDDTTRAGWALGAGIEVKLSPNWSLGAEYLHADFGRTTLNLPAAPAAGPYFLNVSTARFDDREDIARVKLNYYFGAPAPAVAARY